MDDLRAFHGWFNGQPDGAVLLDREGRIRALNPIADRWLRAAGLAPEPGRAFVEMCAPADRPALTACLAAAAAATPGTLDLHLGSGPDGGGAVRLSAGAWPSGDGVPAGVLMQFHDISAQWRRERSAFEREEIHRKAHALSAFGCFRHDFTTGRVFVSRQMGEMFGLPGEGIVTVDDIVAAVHPDDQDRFRREIADVIARREPAFRIEYRVVVPGRQVREFVCLGSVLVDAGGVATGAIGAVQDVTAQKLAAARIESLNRTHAMLSGISHLMVRERDIAAMCAGACRIAVDKGGFRLAWMTLGRRADGAIDICGMAASPPAAEAEARALLERLLVVPEPVCAYTVAALERGVLGVCNDIATDPTTVVWREDVRRLGYQSLVSLPLRLRGRPVGAFNLYAGERDFFTPAELDVLTELSRGIENALEFGEAERSRRALEERLRHVQKMEAIGHLAGGVAHDFNNILAAILMQADLLGLDRTLAPEVRQGLDQIRAAADRASHLTRQLLVFGRRQVMQLRELEVNEVVSQLAKMLRRIIGEDIKLELALSPTPLHTRADPGMIEQAIMNLVVNARDAMADGGCIVLETEAVTVRETSPRHPDLAPGPYVRLVVRDNGPGIKPELLPRLFEPFVTTKEVGKGPGLGLATVFGMVKQHAGSIAAECPPGGGTRIEILLPVTRAKVAPVPAAPASTAAPAPVGTVLLAEDDDSVRLVTRMILERKGYRVLEADNGPNALARLEESHGDVAVLVTDLVMPGGITGQELARRVQAVQPNVRVIYTTGHSIEVAGRHLALRPGENFLQKPYRPDALLKAVAGG